MAALWSIAYAVDAADRAAYCEWFHGVHLPEKLARPGYDWAGHYEGGGRCLALFGGADARAFLDPTPAQLKGRQDDLTRRMVGLRQGVEAQVVVEASAVGSPARAAPAFVRLSWIDAADAPASDTIAQWVVQQRLPELARAGACEWASFLVPVVGGGARLLLEAHAAAPAIAPPAGASRVFEGLRIG